MNINLSIPSIKNLIHKLKISEDIYLKSSSGVHNEFMSNEFKEFAEKKRIYQKEVAKLFEIDLDKVHVEFREELKAKVDIIMIDIADWVIKRNEKAILKTCISWEDELISMYESLTQEPQFDDFITMVLKNQAKDCQKIKSKIESLKSSYTFL